MIATKKNELHIIDSFNDLMKDTKEKQRISSMIKRETSYYFNEYISERVDIIGDSFIQAYKDLSSHYQKHSYNITKKIANILIDENSTIEEYYDGSYNSKGQQVVKERKVIDRNKVSENFKDTIEEDVLELVLENYFKILNKSLEQNSFNSKLDSMEKKSKKDIIEDNEEDIRVEIKDIIEDLVKHYRVADNMTTKDLIANLKNNKEIKEWLYKKILGSIKDNYDIEAKQSDVKQLLESELKKEIQDLTLQDYVEQQEETVEEEPFKIPLGWKAFAITKFIDKMFK